MWTLNPVVLTKVSLFQRYTWVVLELTAGKSRSPMGSFILGGVQSILVKIMKKQK